MLFSLALCLLLIYIGMYRLGLHGWWWSSFSEDICKLYISDTVHSLPTRLNLILNEFSWHELHVITVCGLDLKKYICFTYPLVLSTMFILFCTAENVLLKESLSIDWPQYTVSVLSLSANVHWLSMCHAHQKHFMLTAFYPFLTLLLKCTHHIDKKNNLPVEVPLKKKCQQQHPYKYCVRVQHLNNWCFAELDPWRREGSTVFSSVPQLSPSLPEPKYTTGVCIYLIVLIYQTNQSGLLLANN